MLAEEAEDTMPDETIQDYLGDGAYVQWNGYAFVVFTSNGIDRTNEVYLEPWMLKRLTDFVERIKRHE